MTIFLPMNITANSSIVVINICGFGNYILAVHTIIILTQRFAKRIFIRTFQHFRPFVRHMSFYV